MKIEFKIEDAITPVVHYDTYELQVEYMHGDDDGTTYKTLHVAGQDVKDLELAVVGVLAFRTASENGGWINWSDDVDLIPLFEAQGLDSGEASEEQDSFKDNFYEGDITNEGEAAAIVDFKIFYHDHEGRKYQVSTWVNGREL